MNVSKSSRGFERIDHPIYPPNDGASKALVIQSSAIDAETEDGLQRPGSSYLWVGADHHLDRKEVKELADHLNHWLETGFLDLSREKK